VLDEDGLRYETKKLIMPLKDKHGVEVINKWNLKARVKITSSMFIIYITI